MMACCTAGLDSGSGSDHAAGFHLPLRCSLRRLERRGSVIVFLPQILLLFLFIGILRTRLFARAAVDRG